MQFATILELNARGFRKIRQNMDGLTFILAASGPVESYKGDAEASRCGLGSRMLLEAVVVHRKQSLGNLDSTTKKTHPVVTRGREDARPEGPLNIGVRRCYRTER